DGQKVSDGIYPVLLYYKAAGVLILAYGVSETNKPASVWRELDGAPLVSTYIQEKYDHQAERYGESYVAAAYAIPGELDVADLTRRLDEMIKIYEASISSTPALPQKTTPATEDISVEKELEDLFVDEELFSAMLDRLKAKKNIIL